MSENLKLQELLDEVESKKLVLPDFQRKFVWTQDDMYRLFASVLCKMPFGSILTLESSDREFSCKRFGAKPRTCLENMEENVQREYLLDGQQRLTSLFAGFTTYYFKTFCEKPDDIASQNLLNLYFLKIPAEENDKVVDIFNAKSLDFDSNLKNTEAGYFSSSDMSDLISSEKISTVIKTKNSGTLDFENQDELNELVTFCTNNNDGCYRIPLQFALCTQGKAASMYKKIWKVISSHFSNPENPDSNDLAEEWSDNARSYISQCLSELALNKIKVTNSNKSRAIDIYSNLNKGGVSLNVFDLIMAKVGSISKDNFYDTLVGYIEKEYSYPKELRDNSMLNVCVPEKYSATKAAAVLGKSDEISAEYVNNFLNVLSLYIAKVNRKEFAVDLIKQDKILDLSSKQIVDCSEKVCEAMDRALFFFQTRCGIRSLSDINYKAQFCVVAYLFTDDEIFNNVKSHNFFEYWYWISLFAYMYPSNQNVEILKEIPDFERFLKTCETDTKGFKRLRENAENVFKVKKYSDEDTLTMKLSKETGVVPDPKMTKFVCQFYLSCGYKDFFDDNVSVNFMYDNPLDIHHLMPLGASSELKIGQRTKELRKDKENKFNSPLNMLYITKSSNKTISDWDYSRYTKDERISTVLSQLGCATGFELGIDDFLTNRFKQLQGAVNERLRKLSESFFGK